MLHDCGRFNFVRIEQFSKLHSLIVLGCIPYKIDSSKAQDTDTLQDWEQAEFKFEYIRKHVIARKGDVV